MAKRTRSTLNYTAESLGAALGKMAARVHDFNQQRAALLEELSAITTAAQAMLQNLGHGAGANGGAKRGRPKGYKMSDATRAKLRAAWKRRKGEMAAVKAQTKTSDERANIRSKAVRRN